MNQIIKNKQLNISETSNLLGVSSATVRNWIKCGYLNFKNNTINFNEVRQFQSNIENGRISKLNNRANKRNAKKKFVPDEYFENQTNKKNFENLISYIIKNSLNPKKALFYLTLNFLNKKGLIKINFNNEVELFNFNSNLNKELISWGIDFNNLQNDEYSILLNYELPEQNDILGLIYQSLSSEGNKAKNGSYYTPWNIVNNISGNYLSDNMKVLDPCCGTGQFLLSFASIIKNPENIYGFDLDETAVKIARINLIIKFKHIDFSPKIFCRNFLHEYNTGNNDEYKDFDLIATNPPWGYHFSEKEIKKLKDCYPEITSFESFSYFIFKCIAKLKNNGIISFILPESILNVSTHKDIRKVILKKTCILRIEHLNRLFKNVYSPVVRIDMKKKEGNSYFVNISNKNSDYKINISRWLNNKDNLFDINITDYDEIIIKKFFSIEYKTLKNNATWALGIVTGNNEKHIKDFKDDFSEEIILGKDVEPFTLKEQKKFIKFDTKIFQQAAPEKLFRAPEKLIYKFISRKPVFAYDNKKRLTLNSANILIPKLDYPIKVILALFNSTLYQYYYIKKFSSIKILRRHLEELPLPELTEKGNKKILSYAEKLLNHEDLFQELDDYIMNIFNLDEKEKDYIKRIVSG
jgi:SAM-dependent methyltransferase